MRRCERNNFADTKVSEGEGEEVLQKPEQRFSPAARDAGCPPAVHGGPRWSRSPPVACGSDPTLKRVDA